MHDTPSKDRRVRKTRTLLLEAMGALLHEKPYDAIALKEILHRANVGRSTFYAHFRDKDQLLSSALHDLLRRSPDAASRLPCPERVLRFSLPVLEHIDRQRRAGAAAGSSGMDRRGRALLHQQLEREIARLVTDEVERGVRRQPPLAGGMPAELLIRHVTSSFTAVLDWWADNPGRTPAEVDSLFRALVLPALSRALDA